MKLYSSHSSSPLGELEGALLVENLGYKPDTPVQKGIKKLLSGTNLILQ